MHIWFSSDNVRPQGVVNAESTFRTSARLTCVSENWHQLVDLDKRRLGFSSCSPFMLANHLQSLYSTIELVPNAFSLLYEALSFVLQNLQLQGSSLSKRTTCQSLDGVHS